jgi:class I fructose-bisphosphate aldolase
MGRAGMINSGGGSGENDLAQAVRTAVINKKHISSNAKN